MSDKGLTKDRIKFITHAFKLGIGIIYYLLIKTFDDIINLAEWIKVRGLILLFMQLIQMFVVYGQVYINMRHTKCNHNNPNISGNEFTQST